MKILVWIKEPHKKAHHVWISSSLHNLQKTVGGYIETLTLAQDMVIICNEEGRLAGLEHNCFICGHDFVGTIIIAGVKDEEFASCKIDSKRMKDLFPGLFAED